MIYLIITMLALSVGLLGYLLYINVKKYNKLYIYTEAYATFISALYFKIADNRDKMKEVDKRGSFAADDEVGFIFKELDASVDEIYEFITHYVNGPNNDTSKKEES